MEHKITIKYKYPKETDWIEIPVDINQLSELSEKINEEHDCSDPNKCEQGEVFQIYDGDKLVSVINLEHLFGYNTYHLSDKSEHTENVWRDAWIGSHIPSDMWQEIIDYFEKGVGSVEDWDSYSNFQLFYYSDLYSELYEEYKREEEERELAWKKLPFYMKIYKSIRHYLLHTRDWIHRHFRKADADEDEDDLPF